MLVWATLFAECLSLPTSRTMLSSRDHEKTTRLSPSQASKVAIEKGAVRPVQPPTWSRPTPRASPRTTALAAEETDVPHAEKRRKKKAGALNDQEQQKQQQEEREDGEGDGIQEGDSSWCSPRGRDRRGRPQRPGRRDSKPLQQGRPTRCDPRNSPTKSDGGEEGKEEGGRGGEEELEIRGKESESRSRGDIGTGGWQERNDFEAHARPRKVQPQQQQQPEEPTGIPPSEGFNGGVTSAARHTIVPHSSCNSAERSRSPTPIKRSTVGRKMETFFGNFGQNQRRPCSGAPSHGWRNLARPGGGHGTVSADGEHPRTSRTYVDATVLSRLPTDTGALLGSARSRGWAEGSIVLDSNSRGGRDGGWNTNEEAELQETATAVACGSGISTGAVRNRKQPALVRRLKNTLQALNGSL